MLHNAPGCFHHLMSTLWSSTSQMKIREVSCHPELHQDRACKLRNRLFVELQTSDSHVTSSHSCLHSQITFMTVVLHCYSTYFINLRSFISTAQMENHVFHDLCYPLHSWCFFHHQHFEYCQVTHLVVMTLPNQWDLILHHSYSMRISSIAHLDHALMTVCEMLSHHHFH